MYIVNRVEKRHKYLRSDGYSLALIQECIKNISSEVMAHKGPCAKCVVLYCQEFDPASKACQSCNVRPSLKGE
jgi:hypothetical protein